MVHPLIREELDDARRNLRLLRDAKTNRGAARAWARFLTHSNRAINKLKKYAARTGQEDKYKDLIKSIWKDDFTAYMRNVRNDHEHGIEELSAEEPHSDRVAFPGGGLTSHTVYAMNSEGIPTLQPQVGPTEILWASEGVRIVPVARNLRMVPIETENHGILMQPMVKLEAEDEPAILAAARTYLAWVEEKVRSFD